MSEEYDLTPVPAEDQPKILWSQENNKNISDMISSIEDNVYDFFKGGLFKVAKDNGVKTPDWMQSAHDFLNNPDMNTAIGATTPIRGPGYKAPKHVEESPWKNPDNLEKLHKGYAEGKTIDEIAAEVGTTRGSVASKASREGLDKGRGPKGENVTLDEYNLIGRLYESGLTRKEVAERVGRPEGTVSSTWNRYKNEQPPSPDPQPVRTGGWTAEQIDDLKEWTAKGRKVKDLPESLDNRSFDAVMQKTRDLGLVKRVPKEALPEVTNTYKWTTDEKVIEDLTNMYKEGKTYREIAASIGKTRGQVAGMVNKLGIAEGRQFGGQGAAAGLAGTKTPAKPVTSAQKEIFTETPEDLAYRKSLGFE